MKCKCKNTSTYWDVKKIKRCNVCKKIKNDKN
jgi:hypothetical protein